MSVAVDVVAALALAGAFTAQLVRWLRVLQREHYSPAAMPRFLARWWWRHPRRASTKALVALAPLLALGSIFLGAVSRGPGLVAPTALYGLALPAGLGLRGRTGALRWTRRATTVALVATVASALVTAGVALTS
ncbi:MAG: hypothetical protein ACRDV0_05530, partial [Acidimicrobiales bacterium]